MRWIPVGAIILVSASVALLPAGCGGSEAQEVLASRAGPASTIPGSSGTGTSGTSGSGTSGSGTSGSSGTSGTSGTSGSTDASVSCPPEQEPNNGRDDANHLAPTRCGVIQPNSESDWLTFELKPTTTSMKIDFDGKVTLRVEVDNQSVILGGAVGGKVPFVKGKTYFIEIKATIRDNAVPWRVDLIEQ